MADDEHPSRAKRYLDLFWPLLERGTPVTLLLLLLLGGLTLYAQRGEVTRTHAIVERLYQELGEEKEKRVALAFRVGACEAGSGRGPHDTRETPWERPSWWAVPAGWQP